MATQANNWPTKYAIALWLIVGMSAFAQQRDTILTFPEYLGFVKKYHPRVKQANLEIAKAEASLLSARGAFDPKLEVDFDKKEFKGNEYYSLLNSSFKIPTWYGIEIKAAFDNSEGIYVNPQNTLPDGGLTSLGITVPLGKGLLINQRMADLQKAKAELKLGAAEQRLAAVNAIYDASIAYFNWSKAYREFKLYEQYLRFADDRYGGIIKLIELGDKPAIDSIEAGIVMKSRRISLQDAKLKLMKARIELSNNLWIDNIPLELQDNIFPEQNLHENIADAMQLKQLEFSSASLEEHPYIASLKGKLQILEIDSKLKQNALLPKIDLGYHYLSEPTAANYNVRDYKFGVNFSFPLFLRKERGGLKLNNLKIQDARLELDLQRLQLKNKIDATQNEIELLRDQITLMESLLGDYRKMLESEERLFSFGESSVFLLNTRENGVVNVSISDIELKNRYLISNALLFKILSQLIN